MNASDFNFRNSLRLTARVVVRREKKSSKERTGQVKKEIEEREEREKKDKSLR